MPLYRVTIDRSLCSGFGSCVEASPAVFRLDADGIATASIHETDDAAVLRAADACPMGAILVEEARAA